MLTVLTVLTVLHVAKERAKELVSYLFAVNSMEVLLCGSNETRLVKPNHGGFKSHRYMLFDGGLSRSLTFVRVTGLCGSLLQSCILQTPRKLHKILSYYNHPAIVRM